MAELGSKWYQVCHLLPPVTGETFFRLSFTARSADGTTPRFGIRDSGEPYKMHSEERADLGASWRDYAYDFRLEAIEGDVGFWFLVDEVASVDLARLKLESLSRDDYIEELKARYPEGGPSNLLRQSTFPSGLQSGWALGRDNSDGDDVRLGPDPGNVGPSGQPALKVDAEEATTLWGAPFAVPLAFQPHTASLYTKGSGEVTLTVLREGRHIAANRIELQGDDWQRLSVKFDPALMAQSYCLRIQGTATYWLDALQVNAGDAPLDYEMQTGCEVHLALQDSDASAARVQFEDEPAQVTFRLVGRGASAVQAKVVNLYGEEADISPPIKGVGVDRGTLSYDVFPGHPYGPFRIEAWAEAGEGNVVSPHVELVVNRLPRPRYWRRDAPDSPFGVHTASTTRHNLMAKAVGANWTRLHDAGLDYLGWWYLEREKGVWSFRDKEIERYRRDHIKVLGELGTAPEWASYHPGKNHNGYFDRYYQPRRMEDYANYVRTVTERYKGVIDAYDVWNEPWIWAWWGVGFDETKSDRAGYITSENPQADFVRLQKTAYDTAKAVDPGITILGFNSTTSPGWGNSMGGRDWTQGVLDSGGLECCDTVCYHAYISGKPGHPGDSIEEGFATATGPISEKLGQLPKAVWMTEGSAGRDVIGPGFYNHTLPWENTEDVVETADRLSRYMVRLLAEGCERMFLYSMHGQSFLGADQSWSVIVTPEGQLHPSGVAHGITAWMLEDTGFMKHIEVAEGVHAYLFEAKDGSRSVAAISTGPESAEWLPPQYDGFEVRDLFGNPIPDGEAIGATLAYVTADSTADELAEKLN